LGADASWVWAPAVSQLIERSVFAPIAWRDGRSGFPPYRSEQRQFRLDKNPGRYRAGCYQRAARSLETLVGAGMASQSFADTAAHFPEPLRPVWMGAALTPAANWNHSPRTMKPGT